MEFLCEDLRRHGLLLHPPASPDYARMLADIEARLDRPVDGSPPIPEEFRPRICEQDRPTSAILLNQNEKAVAALHVVWRFETVTGRSYRHSQGMLSAQTLLLQFQMTEERRKIFGYWFTILPGSKRYLGESGMVGDNTDVRPPAPGEKWPNRGGCFGGGGGAGMSGGDAVERVTLSLDGVFFIDGEFVGPNREKLFEQTVAPAEACMLVARLAREGHNQGLSPDRILAQIETVTGPASEYPYPPPRVRHRDAPPEEYRQRALLQIAGQLARQRTLPQFTDERIVHMIMGWAEAALPRFRRG
jgi:hypothetical protein